MIRSLPRYRISLAVAVGFLAVAVYCLALAADENASAPSQLKVGTPAPVFSLKNLDGKPVKLESFRGKKNVVLVTYRGFYPHGYW